MVTWQTSKYFQDISRILQVTMLHRKIFLPTRNTLCSFYWMQRLFLISRNIGYFPIYVVVRKKYVVTLENIHFFP